MITQTYIQVSLHRISSSSFDRFHNRFWSDLRIATAHQHSSTSIQYNVPSFFSSVPLVPLLESSRSYVLLRSHLGYQQYPYMHAALVAGHCGQAPLDVVDDVAVLGSRCAALDGVRSPIASRPLSDLVGLACAVEDSPFAASPRGLWNGTGLEDAVERSPTRLD